MMRFAPDATTNCISDSHTGVCKDFNSDEWFVVTKGDNREVWDGLNLVNW